MGYHSLLSFHFVNMNAFVSLVLLPQLSATSWPLLMDTDLWLSRDSPRTSTRTDLSTLLARLSSLLSSLLLPQLSPMLLLPQLSRPLLPQLSLPSLSQLLTMWATRCTTPSNTCPR